MHCATRNTLKSKLLKPYGTCHRTKYFFRKFTLASIFKNITMLLSQKNVKSSIELEVTYSYACNIYLYSWKQLLKKIHVRIHRFIFTRKRNTRERSPAHTHTHTHTHTHKHTHTHTHIYARTHVQTHNVITYSSIIARNRFLYDIIYHSVLTPLINTC